MFLKKLFEIEPGGVDPRPNFREQRIFRFVKGWDQAQRLSAK